MPLRLRKSGNQAPLWLRPRALVVAQVRNPRALEVASLGGLGVMDNLRLARNNVERLERGGAEFLLATGCWGLRALRGRVDAYMRRVAVEDARPENLGR